jgi:ribosomal protein L11 methyltransferase
MKYIRYTIHTTTEAEEMVCFALEELGIGGVEIENRIPVPDADRQGGIFEELQPDLPANDGSSCVSFYLEENTDDSLLISQIKEALSELSAYTDIGSGQITTMISDEEDWRDNWKTYFTSFTIGDITIRPTWETAEQKDETQVVIEIDPGVSFGTGKHESTQLVIRQLQKYLKKGDQVLDVGCGSGILSIVALKLGAAHVVGTDIDADCIVSTVDNMQVNHLPKEAGEFYVGNLTDDEALQGQVGMECYDLVCANILADIIIPMAPALYRTLRAGGILITSGIIDFKEEAVAEALKVAGFRLAESNAQGEWRSITAEK